MPQTTARPSRLVRPALFVAGAAALTSLVPGMAQPRIYETVEVRGAQQIPEDDIRLTCGTEPGAAYIEDVEFPAIEDCLMSTGVFDKVQVHAEGDTLVLDVTEVRQSPGRVSASVLYASDKGLTASLGYEQYNLLPDTFSAAHLEFSRDVTTYDASLYRVDMLGKDLGLGAELVGRHFDFEDLAFSQRSIQIEGYGAWIPNDHTGLEFGLGYRTHKMFDVDADASPLLRAEAGSVNAPYLRFRLNAATDPGTTDKPVARRLMAEANLYLWNIGTSDLLAEAQVDLNAKQALPQDYELLLGLRGGMVRGLDDNATRAIDRYFPGGDTFRGFAPRGLGPVHQGDMLGGNNYLVGSVELRRAVEFYKREYRIGAFYDIGASWGLDDTLDGLIDDDWHSRSSFGLSLTFDLAETPVSLYVAEPLHKRRADEKQSFGISVSARF